MPGFILALGGPKAKSTPLGGSKPKAQRGGFFCRRAAPRQKAPLGGQQAKGAAWGYPRLLGDDAAAQTDITVIEHGGLPWRNRPLVLGERQRETIVDGIAQPTRGTGLTVAERKSVAEGKGRVVRVEF